MTRDMYGKDYPLTSNNRTVDLSSYRPKQIDEYDEDEHHIRVFEARCAEGYEGSGFVKPRR